MDAARIAGFALAGGALSFALLLVTFGPRLGGIDPDKATTIESLTELHGNRSTYRWLYTLFLATFVTTAAALTVLALRSHAAGDVVFAPAGGALFLLALAAFAPSLMFHAGPQLDAAATAASGGGIAPGYMLQLSWSKSLYTTFMLLAFAALALFGASLWVTRLAPRWAAGFALTMGLVLCLSFATGFPKVGSFVLADLPLWVHVWALIVGSALAYAGPS